MIFEDRPICVVIPTLNEENNIGELVKTFVDEKITIIVVDDNSQDFTGLNARMQGAWVVNNKSKIGYAKSLLQGFKVAVGLECFDYIVTLDAGNKYDANQAYSMLELMPINDLIVGDRFQPFSKYLGNSYTDWITSKLCNTVKWVNVTDWNCGFRIYRENLVRELLKNKYTSYSETIHIELLAKAMSLGATFSPYPVTYSSSKSTPNLKETYRVLKSIYNYPKRSEVKTKEDLW